MLKRFLPKEDQFFTLFDQHAQIVMEGITHFESMLTQDLGNEDLVARLKEIENQADHIAHEVFELLNSVFVTPFDREDIQALTIELDDVVDMVYTAGTRLAIYQIHPIPEAVFQQTEILKNAFTELIQGVRLLADLKQKARIREICIRVNSIENQGDRLLRQALKEMFSGPCANDPIGLIKTKEIVELLESAIDRCEDVATIIETILVKYT